ncbi:MAG: response regulator [bacterium]|nr:response regulator [bacterium]
MARILVIDDEDIVREMLRELLEHEGHEVFEASDGKVGIENYKQQPADLIITDIMMPEKDGFQTIRELKATQPDVKIIALTGFGLHNLPVAYDLGADRVFEKPFIQKEFLQVIRELLEE